VEPVRLYPVLNLVNWILELVWCLYLEFGTSSEFRVRVWSFPAGPFAVRPYPFEFGELDIVTCLVFVSWNLELPWSLGLRVCLARLSQDLGHLDARLRRTQRRGAGCHIAELGNQFEFPDCPAEASSLVVRRAISAKTAITPGLQPAGGCRAAYGRYGAARDCRNHLAPSLGLFAMLTHVLRLS